MKTKHTLALVIVVLLLVIAYLAFFHGQPTGPGGKETVFAAINSDNITELRIELQGRTLALKKSGPEWVFTEPLQVKASDSAVRAILSDIEFLKPERRITKTEDPELSESKYGLDNPTGKLTFVHRKATHTLLIGSRSPTGQYFAAVPGERELVYVIPGSFYDNLDREPNELRDRRPFVFDSLAVNRLSLRSAKEVNTFLFAKEAADAPWRVTAPIQGRADQRKLETVLSTLLDVSVLDFISDAPSEDAKYGLDKPALTASVGQADKQQTLALGSSSDRRNRVYAKLQGTDSIFEVDSKLLSELDKPLNYFRDQAMFTFGAQDIDKIQLQMPDKPLTVLELQGGEWKLKKPYESATYGYGVTNLLAAVEQAQIYTWVSEEPVRLERFGLDQPSMTLTLTLRDGSEQVLLLGDRIAPESGTFYARRPNEPPVFTMVHDLHETAKNGYMDFLTRRLLNYNPAEAVRLTISQLDKPTVVCERIAPDQWQVLQPFALPADSANVDDVVKSMSTLQCFGYTTDDLSNLRKYLLEPPRAVISVELKTKDPQGGEATRTHTLQIGGVSEEHYCQAKFDDGKLIFLIDRRFYKETTDEMVSLLVFKVDPKTVQEIAFVYPDQSVECRRAGDGWEIVKPEATEADADILNELLLLTESLKAVRYASYRAEDLAPYGLDQPSFRLVLKRADGLTSELLIGKREAEDLVYAKNRDSDAVFLLPAALAEKLQKKLADIKTLPVLAPQQ